VTTYSYGTTKGTLGPASLVATGHLVSAIERPLQTAGETAADRKTVAFVKLRTFERGLSLGRSGTAAEAERRSRGASAAGLSVQATAAPSSSSPII